MLLRNAKDREQLSNMESPTRRAEVEPVGECNIVVFYVCQPLCSTNQTEIGKQNTQKYGWAHYALINYHPENMELRRTKY